MSAEERTGWRDEGISRFHREWGDDCPMVDIDFLCIEYDRGLPVALVEYKQQRAWCPDFRHASYRAMAALADRAKIPAICARYTSDLMMFEAAPINAAAKEAMLKHCGQESPRLSRGEWVRLLYQLRGRAAQFDGDETLAERLQSFTWPPQAAKPTWSIKLYTDKHGQLSFVPADEDA